MKTYVIKEEYWSLWGSDVNENTIVTLTEIKQLANLWDASIDELLKQVEEIDVEEIDIEDSFYFWIDTDYHYGDYSIPKIAFFMGRRDEDGSKLRETEEVIFWAAYDDIDGVDEADNDIMWDSIDKMIESEFGFVPYYEVN